MSKKDFTGGLNSLFGEQPEKAKRKRFDTEIEGEEDSTTIVKRGRPVTQFKELNKSSQKGTIENETRATFIINEELLDKLKAIAYWDRVLIKDVVNTALQEYLDKKKPKARPEEARIREQEATQKQIIKNGKPYKARLPKY
jgi:hypothetical protein